jgi:glycine/serine hydroxymethyltransferase
MKEPEMWQVASWVAEVLNNAEDESTLQHVRSPMQALTGKFPLYEKCRMAARSKAWG